MKRFEQVSHTADLQLRVYGATKEELFANALIGMFQILGLRAQGCEQRGDLVVCAELPVVRTMQLDAYDEESLLVDFLSQALYLSDVHNEAYLDVTIHALTSVSIDATLYGVQVNGFEVVEIKAVTYHDLAIKQSNGLWRVDIVFDI